MDGDPAVESELDSFSLTFPLPYRLSFIVVLAVWGWEINLQVLHAHKIDVPQLIRYPARSSPSHASHHLSTYRLATVLSILFAISLSAFWLFTRRDPGLVVSQDWLPLSLLIALVAVFAAPLHRLSSGGRRRFLSSLLRVSIGGLSEGRDGKFGDILLADVLTSMAKVVADFFVVLCMFIRSDSSATSHPDRACGGGVVVPLILAAPSLIRLRQCLIEFARVRRQPFRDATGWGGQHLANAAKYASALPVIVLGTVQRNLPDDDSVATPSFHRAWLAAVVVNSAYSFYWDVAKDWDLTLFSRSRLRSAAGQPYGLRRRLLFRPAAVYYVVVAADLILRGTWTLKLSQHLDRLSGLEGAIFVLELLELVRRWMWIFLRVEAEWLRTTGPADTGVPSADTDIDGVPLSDYLYLGKYQDDDDADNAQAGHDATAVARG